eukprot:TRINITY_DN408_c1_g1_i7.p1 TRINITY_DN408_c1_g1~~TRINITY_DN408_c1_g1_i7.p1  ORF type:complete len:552 (+),score=140.80 TRINITY_DN408_c1_g1_i7:63-1718(+)
MDHVQNAVNTFDEKLEKTSPTKIVISTLAAAYVANKMYKIYKVGLNDTVRESKENTFLFLRKHFGHLLGYDAAMKDATNSFIKEFAHKQSTIKVLNDKLPSDPVDKKEILALCEKMAAINGDFTQGQYSGTIYHGGQDGYTEFINEAMNLHQWTNPLHGGQFSGVRKMEAEAISMVVNMFKGDADACGALTTGGTESILLAMKAYREHAKYERGITEPELVVPVTAHAAFDKAAHYFGIRIRHARMDPVTCKVDMKHMKSLVNGNTIALVGSAPHYPHGIIDPIEEIAAFGMKRGIPVHVDACLGGFIIAFMEKAGLPLDEKFDFTVPGVTSISCDTHKYGFAPKGSSTIMYRNAALRKYQMHSQPNWPGGIYASPTISGSRIGNVVAGTWAALMYHGEKGYVESTTRIVKANCLIRDECDKIPGLKVMGKPMGSVVAIASDEFDIYRLQDYLTERGWEISSLQFPSSLHMATTNLHTLNDMEHAKRLVKDIREGCSLIMETKSEAASGSAALYGTSQKIPDRSIIGDVAKSYFDAYYDVHVTKHAKEITK